MSSASYDSRFKGYLWYLAGTLISLQSHLQYALSLEDQTRLLKYDLRSVDQLKADVS